jgi:hypothetical protein
LLPRRKALCPWTALIGLDPVKTAYIDWGRHFFGAIALRCIEPRDESPCRYAMQFNLVPSVRRFGLSQ